MVHIIIMVVVHIFLRVSDSCTSELNPLHGLLTTVVPGAITRYCKGL